jgi:hypothetical protein
MPDVLLIHPADKRAVALLLAEATTDAGYTIAREEVASPRLLASIVQQRNAKATLLIWSRELVMAIGHEDWLRKLRGRSLIEVSIEGITPPGENVQVEFLSGWRGQKFHPGWQSVHRRIEQLCGSHQISRKGPVEMIRGLVPRRTGTTGRRPATATLFRRPLPSLLAAFAAVAIAAAAWFSIQSQDARQDVRPAGQTGPSKLAQRPGVSRPVVQRSATLPPPPAAAALQAAPKPSSRSREQSATGKAAVPIAEAGAPSAAPIAVPEPVALPARPFPGLGAAPSNQLRFAAHGRTTQASRPGARRAVPAGTKRYSRRYSQTMRLFCQRSGRLTPECRIFRRSTAAR